MTDIESFHSILILECKNNYNNKAVIGGLDRYLNQTVLPIRQGLDSRKLIDEFDQLNLTRLNYATCTLTERKQWIENALVWLDVLKASDNKSKIESIIPEKERGNISIDTYSRRMEKLNSPITVIKGITPRIAEIFSRLGIKTINDLLYFIPRRYIDYSKRKTIAELHEGNDQTIIASILQSRIIILGNRRGTETIVEDKTGNIRIVWFNQPYLAKRFLPDKQIVISGAVNSFRSKLMFTSPEWEFLENNDLIHTGRLVPIYPLTRGLYPRQVRKWAKIVIDGWSWQINDFLPSAIKTQNKMLDLAEAITQIHFPSNQLMAEEARKRLAFDELFLLQLSVLSQKQNWQESQPGNAFVIHDEFTSSFINGLPFTLTEAQEYVLGEIINDLKRPIPMLRLLQGEVGSGKTVIAIFALLIAIYNNFQGAFMAPTEVLAEQHYKNICRYFSENGYQESHTDNSIIYNIKLLQRSITVALLIGSLKSNEKKKLQQKIEQGEIDLVIGTHALIQQGVIFKKLGLAVIDEQQRFGVLQRSALRQKGFNPHILVMTATPIPRTLALTIYGDLDLSIINELPPGRKPIKTLCLEPKDIQKAYSFIRKQINHEKQAFIVCPLIEESEILEVKAAIAEYKYLSSQIFPDFKIGLLHGRMPSTEKENTMRKFHEGEIDILVATSVIEVGIDIPNATVMLIEAADRFGLSQLHQLRGRVGRSEVQSYCILVSEKSLTMSRLQLMENIHNGFALAEKDLELRGPGDFFGTLQSGLPPLKIAKFADLYLLEKARLEAIKLFKEDHNLETTEHYALKIRLSQICYQNTDWS